MPMHKHDPEPINTENEEKTVLDAAKITYNAELEAALAKKVKDE